MLKYETKIILERFLKQGVVKITVLFSKKQKLLCWILIINEPILIWTKLKNYG